MTKPSTPLKQCQTCASEPLTRSVSRWLARRKAGDAVPPLEIMYDRFFFYVQPGASISSVRRHIRTCLRIDHKTGETIQ